MRARPFAAALRDFLRTRPFEPFAVELPTERLVVRHPDAIRQEGGGFRFVEPLGYVHVFDSSTVIQLMTLPPPDEEFEFEPEDDARPF